MIPRAPYYLANKLEDAYRAYGLKVGVVVDQSAQCARYRLIAVPIEADRWVAVPFESIDALVERGKELMPFEHALSELCPHEHVVSWWYE